jgi:glycosyltransferase involved in cell wall biosynthesis
MDPSTFEVVVSIDGHEPESSEVAEEFRDRLEVHVIAGPHRGRAAARNAGIRKARGHLLVFIDDDMQLSPDCLATHLAAHGTDSRRCILGSAPVVLRGDASPVERFIGRKFNAHLDVLASQGRSIVLRDFFSGHFSLPKAVIDEVGAFDEEFTLYGNEDVEFGYRLRRAGVEIVFAPDALAWQVWMKTPAALMRDTRDKGRTAVQLARKHPATLPELQLGSPGSGSWRWRAARRVLLVASRPGEVMPKMLIWAARTAEQRLRGEALQTWYRFLLDYFYWLGVQDEDGPARRRSPRRSPVGKGAWGA